MKKTSNNYYIVIFLCAVTLVLFSSCTDSSPQIDQVYHTLVYDFTDNSLSPKVSLSVFIAPLSDERRIKEMSIIHQGTGYSWQIDTPYVIKDGENMYFGSQSIVAPFSSDIPEGRYDVYFSDLAMRDTAISFILNKLASLKDKDQSLLKVQGFLNKQWATECSIKNIVIYDVLENELYTGLRGIELSDDDAIRSMFSAAVSYREFYKNIENTTVIFLPEVILVEQIEPTNTDEDLLNE